MSDPSAHPFPSKEAQNKIRVLRYPARLRSDTSAIALCSTARELALHHLCVSAARDTHQVGCASAERARGIQIGHPGGDRGEWAGGADASAGVQDTECAYVEDVSRWSAMC